MGDPGLYSERDSTACDILGLVATFENVYTTVCLRQLPTVIITGNRRHHVAFVDVTGEATWDTDIDGGV
jgi:hypothetical protein